MIVTVLTLFLPSKTEDDVVMLPFLPAFSGIGNWMDLASEVCVLRLLSVFSCGFIRQTYGAGWFTYSDWYRNAHNPDAEIFR